jgi:hypothetical protein
VINEAARANVEARVDEYRLAQIQIIEDRARHLREQQERLAVERANQDAAEERRQRSPTPPPLAQQDGASVMTTSSGLSQVSRQEAREDLIFQRNQLALAASRAHDLEMARLVSNRPVQTGSTGSSRKGVKLEKPAPWNGNSKAGVTYFNALKLYLRAESHGDSEEKKIIFCGGLLSGKALDWYISKIQNGEFPWLTCDDFLTTLKAVFHNNNEKTEIMNSLVNKLATESDAAKWVIEYNLKLAGTFTSHEEWEVYLFLKGCTATLRAAMDVVRKDSDVPLTLEEAQKNCIRAAANLAANADLNIKPRNPISPMKRGNETPHVGTSSPSKRITCTHCNRVGHAFADCRIRLGIPHPATTAGPSVPRNSN